LEEDLEKTEKLIVNGEASLMIRRNLASYFRHVRDSLADEDEESWPVWVDAICINQQDIKERNAQVPRMREIYKLAYMGVTVWLGPETDDSTAALQFIKEVGGPFQFQARNFPGTKSTGFLLVDRRRYVKARTGYFVQSFNVQVEGSQQSIQPGLVVQNMGCPGRFSASEVGFHVRQ
jgi:hypothetical protein